MAGPWSGAFMPLAFRLDWTNMRITHYDEPSSSTFWQYLIFSMTNLGCDPTSVLPPEILQSVHLVIPWGHFQRPMNLIELRRAVASSVRAVDMITGPMIRTVNNREYNVWQYAITSRQGLSRLSAPYAQTYDCATLRPHAHSLAPAKAKGPRPAMSCDIPKIWKDDIEPRIKRVLRGEHWHSDAAFWAMHTTLYTAVYNICHHYDRASLRPRSANGRDLHAQATAFLSAYTAQIQAAAPDDDAAVPYYYDTQWDTFTQGAVLVDRAFTYLNRYFVKHLNQPDIKTIRNVALQQWKINVFELLAPRLERALGADATRIAGIRAKFALENVTAEHFNAMRFHEGRKLFVKWLMATVFAICSITPKSASARELHAQATSFLSGYTAQIQAAAPDDDAAVPYYYDTQWDTFARGAYSIDPAFIPMNKLFVQCQTDMKTIRNVALEQWKINVFEALAPRLERALGTDATRIAVIRTKLASENATVEDFNSMRFHEVYAGSA
ncbi:hypothetical protein DFH06DRAFT_1437788 [Mycena polygramma]|nr:hypothetical protein DFH06DRAFT_1437788 [Mycena polygramma]